MAKPFVSICIITGGNLPHLDDCLASIQSQQDAPAFEVIVCANGCSDVSAAVKARIPQAIVGRAERSKLGAARNPLIRRAAGEWLLFLDDDVTIRPTFLADLHRLAGEHPEASVLGGPNDTPEGTPVFQVIQGAVLASMVVSGPVRRRYGPHPAGPADERFFTLCNLAVRRTAMVSFPPSLVGAEENAVLAELHRRGLRMHYDPALAAFHARRPTLRSFAAQMYKYGLGRGQLTRRSPTTMKLPYLIPSAFVIYLVGLLAVGWMNPMLAAPLVLYAAAVGATALKIAWELRSSTHHQLTSLVVAATLAVTVHVYYGIGFLRGLAIPPAPDVPEPQLRAEQAVPGPFEPAESRELTPTA